MPNTFKCFVRFQATPRLVCTVEFDVELEDGESPDSFAYHEWRDILHEEAERAMNELFIHADKYATLQYGLSDD